MATSKELLEQRGELQKTLDGMVSKAEAENRDFSAEERQNYDKLIADDDALKARIDRLAETEKRSKAISTAANDVLGQFPAQTPAKGTKSESELRDLAFEAWARTGSAAGITEEHRDAARQLGIDLANPEFTLQLLNQRDATKLQLEMRDMATTTGSGKLIPQGFSGEIERSMFGAGDLMRVVRTYRTTTGNPIPWPTSDDTGNIGALLTEASSIGSSVDPTISSVTLNSYQMSSKVVLISNVALRDYGFDWATIIGQDLGARLGRIVNSYGTTGTGSSEPQGIITGATSGLTTVADTLDQDDILELKDQVDPAYWPNAGWMMHAKTRGLVRRMKDSQNRYLWQPSLVAGAPDTFDGHPVYLNQYMDDCTSQTAATTGTKPVLFGDFSKFVVRIVQGVRNVRLNERYADTDQTAFVSFLSVDSKVLNSAALKYITIG